MRILTTIILALCSIGLFGQCCEVSTLPFCVDIQISNGVGNDRDTLNVLVDGNSCHGILLPRGSVSTVTENITTVDHNGSGYFHSNGFTTTTFGYRLELDDAGCLVLLNWEGVQSGEKFCP